MKLSSKPKPVNFRIVLSSAEITSIESLQRFFHFERLLVTDQSQFISWLKRVDKIRGREIESILNQPIDETTEGVAIAKILNIIYEPDHAFNNMVDFVNFLYENNDYEVVKSNFSNYISKHGEKLHKLFPLDVILKNIKNINNLYDFFGGLDASKETSSYLAQLYYRHDKFEISRKISPSSWKLQEKERSAIQAIVSGNQHSLFSDVVISGNLSILGVEFIFLCAIAFMSLHHNDARCIVLSELIDDSPSFKSLRERMGGSLKMLINKKDSDFYKIFKQLGYVSPDVHDPLFNEKLFLSSFFAGAIEQDKMRAEIRKNGYFPALFDHNSSRFESQVLQNKEGLQYPWLRLILDYYDNPTGLEGDEDLENNDIREMAVIVHQFKEKYKLMSNYFHFPSDLSSNSENTKQRERISNIKSSIATKGIKNVEEYGTTVSRDNELQKRFESWAKNPPALNKTERKYLDFFNEVVNICNQWEEYIIFNRGNKGNFTPKAESLIKKFKEENKILWKEKLFVVAILLLVRDHNNNKINEEKTEMKQLKKTYIPLRALFRDEVGQLKLNDKKILKSSLRAELLRNNWLVSNCSEMRDINYRKNFYGRILRRWIANFVYYTD